MMRPSDYYARKFGNPQQQPPPGYVPQAVPQQQGIQVPVPNGTYGVQAGSPAARPFRDPNEEVHMGEAIREWNGGEGTKKETRTCERCGAANNFTDRTLASKGTGRVMGHPPAARCYNCGHNPLFEQFSDVMTTYDGNGGSLPFTQQKQQ